MIIIIAAVAQNNALGLKNQLVWHLPNDFKRFKALTTGHHIIMGRKTFESFAKPLPNRTHIIITKQLNYQAPNGCIVVNALDQAIAHCKNQNPLYIIGGGEIYKQAMAISNKLEITRVHASFEADTFFPEINPKQWQLVASTFHAKDEKHAFDYTYETYLKV